MSAAPSDDPGLERLLSDLSAVKQRQDQLTVRCMALENVMQGLAAVLTTSLPEVAAARFLRRLEMTPPLPIDPAMGPAAVETIRQAVEREQQRLVGRLREEHERRLSEKSAGAKPG